MKPTKKNKKQKNNKGLTSISHFEPERLESVPNKSLKDNEETSDNENLTEELSREVEEKPQESMLSNKDVTNEVSVKSADTTENDPAKTNEESESTAKTAPSVFNESSNDKEDTNNNENSIEELHHEIEEKIKQLESSEQYKSLINTIDEYQLLHDSRANIQPVIDKIIYANQYIKVFSEKFLEILISTDWFERFYDTICLYDRAHDSTESLEWCEALRDSLNESISDTEKNKRKIKALFNDHLTSSVFTLSLRTPYLRLKTDIFNQRISLKPIIAIQVRSFYNWIKNIENLSLTLRNYWLELHQFSLKRDTYFEDALFNLEEILEKPLSQHVSLYIDENVTANNSESFYYSILEKINLFIDNIADIESFYKKQYDENRDRIKYLTEKLLDKYYRTDLESIYRIYDEIRMSIDYVTKKFDPCEELTAWCNLLNELAEAIKNLLSQQNIFCSPELVIGESNINNNFEIENKLFNFFNFAKIAIGVEAPREELKDCVASVSKYGFYLKESESDIKIIRETTTSVYN